jgi:putative thioredoxin
MNLIGGLSATPADSGADAGLIKDGSLESFARDVIQESMRQPVLVDFWAPWCGPCKQLTPVLEKVVKQAGGKVKLVKIDIDQNPELAQQLRVQSVPTVYAFLQGQPVTGFAGAQPESQIKALIEKLVGGPLGPADSESQLAAAKEALDAGELEVAGDLFGAVLEQEEANPEALGGLARVLLASGQLAEAEALLQQVPDNLASHAAISGAKAALELAKEAGTLGDPTALLARIESNPDDHDARHELATALFLRGQIEAAMDHLCQIVKRDREWREDGARKQLVTFFNALGPTHPQTVRGRRMLSTVLFS